MTKRRLTTEERRAIERAKDQPPRQAFDPNDPARADKFIQPEGSVVHFTVEDLVVKAPRRRRKA